MGFDPAQVITIKKDQTFKMEEEKEDYWGELKNSQITKKILSGVLSSVERIRISDTETVVVGVVIYHQNRIIIPLSEMNIQVKEDSQADVKRQKIINNMIGCEIDFVVLQLDAEKGSVVASRKVAMEKKFKDFYVDIPEGATSPVITVGSVVEARIIAVSENLVRVEIFGAECFIPVRNMRQLWTPNARDVYNVGSQTVVRIEEVTTKDGIAKVRAEAKSLYPKPTAVCKKGDKYLGTVTGISEGTYFICLEEGVNAIAFSCDYGFPLPRKNDKVTFVCTRFDKKEPVAAGIITRIVQKAPM